MLRKEKCACCIAPYEERPLLDDSGKVILIKTGKNKGQERTNSLPTCDCINIGVRVELDLTPVQKRFLNRMGGIARALRNTVIIQNNRIYRGSKRAESLARTWKLPEPEKLAIRYEKKHGAGKRLLSIDWYNWMNRYIESNSPRFDHWNSIPSYVKRDVMVATKEAIMDAISKKKGFPRPKRRTNDFSFHCNQPGAILVVGRDFVQIGSVRGEKKEKFELHLRRIGFVDEARWDSGTNRHVGKSGTQYRGYCISRRGDKYFLSMSVLRRPKKQKKRDGTILGFDLGHRNPVVDSEGRVYLVKNEEKIQARLDRYRARLVGLEKFKASKHGPDRRNRSKRPSKSWLETVRTIRRVHEKIANLENDLRHKRSRAVVDTGASTIAMEDLEVARMTSSDKSTSNHSKKARKNWLRLGAGELRRQISYKSVHAGADVKLEDPAYTSRQCHRCGTVNERFSSEHFKCSGCGFGQNENTPDRDVRRGQRVPKWHRDRQAAMNLADADRFREKRKDAKSKSKTFRNENSGEEVRRDASRPDPKGSNRRVRSKSERSVKRGTRSCDLNSGSSGLKVHRT